MKAIGDKAAIPKERIPHRTPRISPLRLAGHPTGCTVRVPSPRRRTGRSARSASRDHGGIDFANVAVSRRPRTSRAPHRRKPDRGGIDRNIEIGLLVRDRTLAATMTRHFTTLIERSLLQPLAGLRQGSGRIP